MEILTDFFIPPMVPERTKSVRLKFDFYDAENELNAEEFWKFCEQNDKLQIELVKRNEIKITFPKGFQFSKYSIEVLVQLHQWNKTFQTGEVFNHLIGYLLPNKLIFSPSFSWTEKSRFETLDKSQKENLIHLCPDFVIEITSFSDSLSETQEKMAEYIENGARLGWLIDPKNKNVHIYRANGEIEVLENPNKVSGEDVLQKFELDLTEIW